MRKVAVRTFAAIDVGSFELELRIYEMTYKTESSVLTTYAM